MFHPICRRLLSTCLGLIAVLASLPPAQARADELAIRGGGVIQGAVLPTDPARPDVVRVLSATTVRPFEFRKEQILRITPGQDALSQYPGRAAQLPDTAAAHFEFAQWCKENSLKGPAQIHLERAVTLDPTLAPAHEQLGHVLHAGRWMTLTEKLKSQGLVQFRGRWVSPEEKARLQGRETFAADQENWTRRARRIRQMLLQGDPAQAAAAEEELSNIHEPAAVFPILKAFSADSGPIRLRAAQAISSIPGREAREGLVQLVLTEPDPTLRQAFFQELESRKEPEVITRLLKALDVRDPEVVGRAAWSLAMLDAVQSVPRLIRVLVKSEEKWVIDPAAGRGGNISVGFGNVAPGGFYPAGAGAVAAGGATGQTGGVGLPGGTGSTINPPIPGAGVVYPVPILTGPVVGPGVVAFGATSAPMLDGFAFGNGNPNRPTAYQVTNVYQNEMVLQALESLTGVNLGFDQAAWRHWLAQNRRDDDEAPRRRIQQP